MSVGMTRIWYHSNCFDGFGAAWVAGKAIGGVKTFQPLRYGEVVPIDQLNPDDHLYVLDFSFARESMEEAHKRVAKMLVLDHHKTAQEACAGLPFCVFDMDRSGAGMCWDYFHSGPRSKLIQYIEDRDLWRFKLPHSKEIHAWISSFPKVFSVWDELESRLENEFNACLSEANAILRFQAQKAEEMAAEACVEGVGDYQVPVVNCPYNFGSDVAHRLLDLYPKHPFAAYWFIRGDGTAQYGLRGRDSDDFDVSMVAKQFGGGGHKKAAGFEVMLDV